MRLDERNAVEEEFFRFDHAQGSYTLITKPHIATLITHATGCVEENEWYGWTQLVELRLLAPLSAS